MKRLLYIVCLFLFVGCRQEPQELPMVDPPVVQTVPSVVKEPVSVPPTPTPQKKHRLFPRLRLRQVPPQTPVL